MQNGEAAKPGFAPDRSMCYGPSDLRMGTCIAVYGRMFFIHDCDEFTRHWLKVSFPFVSAAYLLTEVSICELKVASQWLGISDLVLSQDA